VTILHCVDVFFNSGDFITNDCLIYFILRLDLSLVECCLVEY
jgi:hypothetical protein